MKPRLANERSLADEIARARHAFIAALRRGDAETAAAAYTDDARLLAPSAEPLRGRIAIARFWQAGVEAGVEAIELESFEVDVQEGADLAYEIGRYVISLRPDRGGRVTDRGRYLLVYRRGADGVWRRAVESFNPDPQPAMQRTSVRRARLLTPMEEAI